MGITSGLTKFVNSMVENQRAGKLLRTIRKQNANSQGLVYYKPSDIEAFFEDNEPLSDMLVSGGVPFIRNKCAVRAVECGFVQHYATIVLHCGNQSLEQQLADVFGSNLFEVNKFRPLYEPVKGKNDVEACKLFTASAPSRCRIGPAGKNYLTGMLGFMHAKNIQPYSRMFIECPHQKLFDIINQAEAKGSVTPADAQSILSLLTQGESEKSNIEEFFYTLDQQGAAVLAQKQDAAVATNCIEAHGNGQVFCLDVLSWTNDILIRLALQEAETLLSRGEKVMVVLSEPSSVAEESLAAFLRKSGGNLSVVLTADDAYAAFSGSDNDFFTFAGKCSKTIVSRHTSAYSCQKFADLIGTYEKREVSTSVARSNSYSLRSSYSVTQTTNVSEKRENIVKPVEIQRLPVDTVYLVDKQTGMISRIPVL